MVDGPPSVREQILAAAVRAATIHGVARLSMGDVAREAKLSRQTLYRHFPNKDALIAEVVLAETNSLIERAVEAGALHHDPRASLEAALTAALRAAREHPLLDRIVRTEPETLLPLLVTAGGPVTHQVRSVVESIITTRLGDVEPSRLRRLADVTTRLLVSYAVSAPDDPPEDVAAFMASLLTDTAVSELPTPARNR